MFRRAIKPPLTAQMWRGHLSYSVLSRRFGVSACRAGPRKGRVLICRIGRASLAISATARSKWRARVGTAGLDVAWSRQRTRVEARLGF